ncbi:MAG: GNAT family N-acetyltransferase [Janthinobacterium lividum]
MIQELPVYSEVTQQEVLRIFDGDGQPIAEAITDVRHETRWITNVWVKFGHRNKGLGRKVLAALLAAHSIGNIYLQVRAYDGLIMPDEVLVSFYSSFGFTPTAVPGIMVRVA